MLVVVGFLMLVGCSTPTPVESVESVYEPRVVLQYKIVEAKSAEDLEEKVAVLFAEGWQPLGGHQFAFDVFEDPQAYNFKSTRNRYQQTMVKR